MRWATRCSRTLAASLQTRCVVFAAVGADVVAGAVLG